MYRIGIDLGGTNIKAGVVNDQYEIVASAWCKTRLPRPSQEILMDMARMAREAAEKKMDYILSCKQDRIYRGHDLRGLLQYEDHMHALGVDILYPFEQD